MSKIGYVRVSTEDQNEGRQVKLMEQHGVEKVFVEKISGKNTNRPQLKAMMEYVRDGDVVFVESYSRLARNTADLLRIIEQLKEKGVDFVSVKEKIDTSSASGRLMLTIFAGLAQFERECLLERQREGIRLAKEQGKYKGRKPISVDEERFADVYKMWKDGQITAVKAMEMLNLKRNTFYRRVKEYDGNCKKKPDLKEKQNF